MGFDIAGLAGSVATGFMLDKWFKGNWAALCLVMSLGVIGGYLAVLYLGASPIAIALCFSIVGFMLYGPDILLSGAGPVEIAGARNGMVVAGIVNGLGSIGPIVQEEVIGRLVRGDVQQGMLNTNRLALGISVLLMLMFIPMVIRLRHARMHKA